MKIPIFRLRAVRLHLALLIMLASLFSPTVQAQSVVSHYADVNGTRLHYLMAGSGEPIVLLHGYAETSRMWLPLIKELAKTHTVIAPDLRGAGSSAAPATGYSKASMARDIHGLTTQLGFQQIGIVGHDIGLMVAYAYAAQYPAQVKRIVLMDAFLPGVGNWTEVWLLRDLWHFHFYGPTPLALVTGRERTYLEHFWNDFAANPDRSIPEPLRQFYTKEYAKPGHMKAGMEYFRNFAQDAKDFEQFAKTPLTMPMLILSGERASGAFLIAQGKLIAADVHGETIKGAGHWLMEEAPAQVIPKLVEFLNR